MAASTWVSRAPVIGILTSTATASTATADRAGTNAAMNAAKPTSHAWQQWTATSWIGQTARR